MSKELQFVVSGMFSLFMLDVTNLLLVLENNQKTLNARHLGQGYACISLDPRIRNTIVTWLESC